MKYAVLVIFSILIISSEGNELFKDSFSKDLSNWQVEQKASGKVFIDRGKLRVIDESGCTIWFKHKLPTGVKIEYDITMIDQGGKFDRVSDMNCFWMASDPSNNDFFANSKNRGGHFTNYHTLKLYYVGYGGHNNSKTRFRRYTGMKKRPLLPEHDLSDKKFMNKANEITRVKIISDNGRQEFYVNNKLIFKIHDDEPYTSGYFGFRTIKNHMLIDNFQVTKLNN